MSDAHMETVHVIVKGKVQGVGYRHAAVRRAHMLGVTGWVQNLPTARSRAVVQGTDQVDHMLEWLRRGPPAAQVRELASERSFEEKRYKHFAQL